MIQFTFSQTNPEVLDDEFEACASTKDPGQWQRYDVDGSGDGSKISNWLFYVLGNIATIFCIM